MAQTSRDTGFLEIANKRDLADFLGMPLKTLSGLAYGPGMRSYLTFTIEKRRHGEYRRIDAPNRHLKKVQRQLASEFDEIYDPLPCVHGFLTEESIVTNAKGHVGKYALLNLDIMDFFPSITANRIHGLFTGKPFFFPEEVANTLTELVCYGRCLPQGAPTSPILSNFICHRMDRQLMSFANQHRLLYSRYADDMTFSSTSARSFNKVVYENRTGEITLDKKLASIIEDNGFTINQEKTHVARRSSRQMVNGIVVNEKCNFKRADYQALRRLFWIWQKRGYEEASISYISAFPQYARRVIDEDGKISEDRFKRHVRGRLDFYTMICSENSTASSPLLRLWTWYHDLTFETVPLILPEKAIFRTECRYDKDGVMFADSGTCFHIDYRLITCKHCLYDNEISQGRCCTILSQQLPIDKFECSSFYDLAVFNDLEQIYDRRPRLRINAAYLPQIGEQVIGYGFAIEDDSCERAWVCRRIPCHVAERLSETGRIRVDRPFIKGMSGGPVFNTRGEVIGFIIRGSDVGDYMFDGGFVLLSAVPQYFISNNETR